MPSRSKPSLLSFINRVSLISGVLLLTATAIAIALTLQILSSTNRFIEEVVPRTTALGNANLSTETALNLVRQLNIEGDVRAILATLSASDSLSAALKRALREVEESDLQDIDTLRAPYQRGLSDVERFQSLLERKVEYVRARQTAETKLNENLRLAGVELDKEIVDVEHLSLDGKGVESGDLAYSEQIRSLREIHNSVEKIQYELAKTLLVDDEKAIRLGLQSITHMLRDSVESMSYLISEIGKKPAFIVLADIYTNFLSEEGYGAFRLQEIGLKQTILSEKQALIDDLENIQQTLDAFSSQTQIEYGLSLKSAKKSGEIALVTLGIILLISIATMVFSQKYFIPKRILVPLSLATKAVHDVGSGKSSFAKFDTQTQELSLIHLALEEFVNSANTLKKTELDLSLHKSQLDKLDQDLKTFMRVSSHDLKSPLRGIALLCEMIREDIEDNAYQEASEKVYKIGMRVSRLYNLLDALLAFVHAGEAVSDQSRKIVSRVVAEQIDLLEMPDSVSIHTELEHPNVSVVETPFAIVLRNLVDNAIKHHDSRASGKVWVHLRALGTNMLSLSVKDDGPGIPIHYQKRIFEPFETLKPKDTVEGSGMGLAIIAKLIHQIGGEIQVKSPVIEGRGSEFIVTWPI